MEFELTGFVVHDSMSFTITDLYCKRFILTKLMLDKKESLYRSTLYPNFCFKYFWSFSNLSLILSRPEAFS